MMNRLIKINNAIQQMAGNLSILLVLVLLILVVYSVVSRSFHITGTFAEEISRYALTSLVLLAAGYTLANDKHVRVEFILDRVNTKVRRLLNIFSEITALILFCIVLYPGINMTLTAYNWHLMSESDLRVPLWIPQCTVPIAAVLLILQTLINLYKLIWQSADSSAQDK